MGSAKGMTGRVEPPTPTGPSRAKLRHSINSTVSCGSHALTDYILYTLLDGFPLWKDHTVNVDGIAPNDDILGAE